MFVLIQPGKSLTYVRNCSDPKTEPWGNPTTTSTQCEQLLLTVTFICLSSKKDFIHCSVELPIPNIDNFYNNLPDHGGDHFRSITFTIKSISVGYAYFCTDTRFEWDWNAPERRSGPFKTTRLMVKLHQACVSPSEGLAR